MCWRGGSFYDKHGNLRNLRMPGAKAANRLVRRGDDDGDDDDDTVSHESMANP